MRWNSDKFNNKQVLLIQTFSIWKGVLQQIGRFLGLDIAIIYTILSRGWAVIAGPITFFFLAHFLSAEEQGFYYTFGSVLNLQIFFELGVSLVILQFVSHEKAHLHWSATGLLEGDHRAKERLAALLRLAFKWYAVATLLFIIVVLPIGLLFFASRQPTYTAVTWQFPWLMVVLVTGGSLLISPFLSFLEGCGLVADVALMRVGQSILGNLLLWFALTQHWGLFAAGVVNGFGVIWSIVWLWRKYKLLFYDLLRMAVPEKTLNWRQEVWPFQWKIALSWLSGYFIFQLFNPLLFAFRGPVAAGQMGMSLSIMGAMSTVALAWVNTKAAPFGILIARREFKTLDRIFFTSLWQSFGVLIFIGSLFWITAYGLAISGHPVSQRILSPLPLFLLVVTIMINHIVSAEAIYLRAYKQEPFLIVSIVNGICALLLVPSLGFYFGALGMTVAYFLSSLIVGLGGGTWVFMKKRGLWREI